MTVRDAIQNSDAPFLGLLGESLTDAMRTAIAIAVEANPTVHCKEVPDKDGDVEFHLDIEREFDTILGTLGVAKTEARVAERRGAGRRFHDREIDLVVVGQDGAESRYRYFLTGGIDLLLNQQAATRVFAIRLENA